MVITATLIDDLLSIGTLASKGIDGVDHEKFKDVTGQVDVTVHLSSTALPFEMRAMHKICAHCLLQQHGTLS
ncbi:hypothetical protein ACLOJK_032419, partial [Asimina triloba]